VSNPALRLRKTLYGAAYGQMPVTGQYASVDQTTFAALLASNFDGNGSKRKAIRFSPGLYLTQFANETQKNCRFSVGPVFRFGAIPDPRATPATQENEIMRTRTLPVCDRKLVRKCV
jgi:hypothetical protein